MKVTGSAVLHASPDAVYTALTDPAVLSSTIPGCESLTAVGEDRYRMTITAGVASIKGTYEGEVSLHEKQVPSSFVLKAHGAGAPGTIEVSVPVTISDVGDGTSRLDYDADAVVGGMVGGVGQRMLTSVSKKMAGQFFGNVDDVITGKRAAVVAAPEAAPSAPAPAEPVVGGPAVIAPAAGQVFRPPAPPAGAPGALANPLAAALVGAGIALAGVLVGWLAGRRRG
ncbi:MAG TPA: carbon monoxide dehydrogenase subunit G [Actinomycetales bacterium]|nr:carbon monoxide dehydrogenase subunit G [Actinomycetales bacterium]